MKDITSFSADPVPIVAAADPSPQHAAFRIVQRRVAELLAEGFEGEIRSSFELGKLLQEVRGDPQKYGPQSFRNLEESFATNKNRLAACVQFYERFSEADLDRLLGMRDNYNVPLSWTHVNHALHLPDNGAMWSILEQCTEQSWTTKQLQAEVHRILDEGSSQKPVGTSRKSGRPMYVPKDLKGFADQIEKHVGEIQRRMDVWFGKSGKTAKDENKSLLDLLNEVDPETLSDAELARLEEVAEFVQDFSMKVGSDGREVSKAVMRVKEKKSPPPKNSRRRSFQAPEDDDDD